MNRAAKPAMNCGWCARPGRFHCLKPGCEWLICPTCARMWNAWELSLCMHLSDLYDPEHLYGMPSKEGR
jgi:hypothetical protein